MFHKLKQKASLARVNILTENNANSNINVKKEKDSLPSQKPRTRSLQPINETATHEYSLSALTSQNATPSQQPQAGNLRKEFNRMVQMKQDALTRLRRADAQRLEATNRADLLAQQLEIRSHEVSRLQVELQRKHEQHEFEKQAILQDSLERIMRNDTAHDTAQAQLQQALANLQSQKDAELRTQKDRLTRQLMEVERTKNAEVEEFKKRSRDQEEEIRILRHNLRSEIQARNPRPQGDTATPQQGQQKYPVRIATGGSGWGVVAMSPSSQSTPPADTRIREEIDRLSHEVESLRRHRDNLECALAALRQQKEEQQQAREGLQAELEEKTQVLEERTLALNRMRNELNEEKRKCRQALADNTDKNRQFEFVQQECARMQVSLSQRTT